VNFETLAEKGIKKSKNLFRINGDSKRRIKASSNGGVGGVFSPVGDVSDGVTVDTDAGDGAVDLEPRLEIEDGTVKRKTHDDYCRWWRWPCGGSFFLRWLR
jgi:hypothetical protein